jgi:hypothetical protein
MLSLRPVQSEPIVGTCSGPDVGAKTIVAGRGRELAGAAFVTRRSPPGPPLRGAYYVETLPASGAEEVLAHCIAWVARQGGRRLWSYVPLVAVDAWRRCGFAIAGPPQRLSGDVGMLMVRAVDRAERLS